MMNIDDIMAMSRDVRKQNSGNLTLGQLENKLNKFKDDEKFILSDEHYLTGDFGSYRGYYEDLYLEFSNNNQGFDTIGQLKETIKKAYAENIMIGYKGGEFPINKNTLIWVSTHGNCGKMFIDIQKINGAIVLFTKEDED